jgi:two-component system, LytTR family, sensor histidine kinase AlgZ
MHPILGNLRRLSLYLLGWIPLAAILFYLLVLAGGLKWTHALAMAVPLCLVYAFMCLSAWYSCRSTPLEGASFWRPALTHLVTAIILSAIWVLLARGLTIALGSFATFRGIDQKFLPNHPLLFASGVLLYLLAVALHYVLLSMERSRELERREMQARVLARDSELKALKAQINPHFLFNSLNSISALTSIDSGRARDMCIQLADFLRKTLGMGEKTVIPLREELDLVRSFLAVEKVRFGARLSVGEKVASDALDCAVPPLLLQPLVENAVAHGISNLTEGGWINVEVLWRDQEGRTAEDIGDRANGSRELFIQVANNFDPEMPRRRGAGVGLVNVRQRIATRYGDRASFSAQAENDQFRVAITIPAEKMEAVK